MTKDLNAVLQDLSQRDLRLKALERGVEQIKVRMNSLKVAAALGLAAAVGFAGLWLYERMRNRGDRKKLA